MAGGGRNSLGILLSAGLRFSDHNFKVWLLENRDYIGVFSNRQHGRLPGNFDSGYTWVQILAP